MPIHSAFIAVHYDVAMARQRARMLLIIGVVLILGVLLFYLYRPLFQVTRVSCDREAYGASFGSWEPGSANCYPPEPGEDSITCKVRGEVANPARYRGPVDTDACEPYRGPIGRTEAAD